jgi:hypothetical protein
VLGLQTLKDRWAFARDAHRLRRTLSRLSERPDPDETVAFLFSDDAALIQPWQYPEEFRALARLVHARRPRTVLEIGTADEGTLFAHTRLAADEALIISVDLPHGEFGGGYPPERIPIYASFGRPGQRVELLRAYSHAPETADHLAALLGDRRVDYAFINGDHTYEGVRQDFELRHGDATMNPRTRLSRLLASVVSVRDRGQEGYGIGVLYLGESTAA